MKNKTLFIAMEGGEGCGKSTQIKLLWEKMKQEGWDVAELTKEPGSPHLEFNKQIRQILIGDHFKEEACGLSEVALFLADRANHLEKYVKPNLAAGRHVITDRSEGSSFAYQALVLKNMSLSRMKDISETFTRGVHPDITIYLDVPAAILVERLKNKRDQKTTHYDWAALQFHEQLRWAFLKLSTEEKNWVTVDGLGTVEEVAARVWAAVEKNPG